MKTKIVTFFFFFLAFSVNIKGQGLPVYDNTAFIQAIAQIKNMVSQLRLVGNQLDLAKNLQKMRGLKELKSIIELSKMVDEVACLTSEYSYYMSLGGNRYDCLKFLNFQEVKVDLKVSTDLLFKIATVTDFFSMSSGERTNFLNQSREAMQSASKKMREFNKSVQEVITRRAVRDYTIRNYYTRPKK